MSKVAKIASGTAESVNALTDAVAMFGAILKVTGSDVLKTLLAALPVAGVSLAAGPASAFVLGAAALSGSVALYKAIAACKEGLRQEQCHEWIKAANDKLNELLRDNRDFFRAVEAMAKAEADGTFEVLEPAAYGSAAPQIVQFQALLRMRRDQRADFDRMFVRFDTLEGDVEILTKYAEENLRLTKEIREDVKKLPDSVVIEMIRRMPELVAAMSGTAARELTQKQKVERAYAELAQAEGVPVDELKANVRIYVESVRQDPNADPMEKARAEYVAANYLNAAKEAGDVAALARARRLARDERMRKQAAEAAAKSAADRVIEREALILSGQSFYAARQFGKACEAYTEALEITPKEEDAPAWAALQLALGDAADEWANISEGADIAARRARAIDACRHALEVYTHEALPQNWATTQNDLGVALRNQAAASEGAERARKLGEAVSAYRSALEVYTREALPNYWAATQNNLGAALRDQAVASEGAERARLLAEAVETYRSALEVYTRESLPQYWAMTQNNLGLALSNQAAASEGAERARLLGEAVAAFRNALKVRTRESLPQDWAMTQNNLGNALGDQATASEGAERARLLVEAVDAYRNALEVLTRESLPQDWAMTQNNLGNALSDQAAASEGAERARLLGEAVVAYRSALEVRTREALPQDWAMTQYNLGTALSDQAAASEGAEKVRLLGGAVAAYRNALEVLTRESLPQDWAMTQNNLGTALRDQAAEGEGAEKARLLGEAVNAYRRALEVRTREHLPLYWTRTSGNLALALRDLFLVHLDAGRFDEAEAIFRENASLAVPGKWTFLGMCLKAVREARAKDDENPLLARAEALLLELGAE
jgi:tetratricopeptide (TPR) repeat protein